MSEWINQGSADCLFFSTCKDYLAGLLDVVRFTFAELTGDFYRHSKHKQISKNVGSMKAEILCHLFLSPQYWQLLDTEEAPKFGRWINEWIQFINNPVNSTSKIEAKLVYFSPIHCLDLSSYHSHLNGSSSPLPTLPTSTPANPLMVTPATHLLPDSTLEWLHLCPIVYVFLSLP